MSTEKNYSAIETPTLHDVVDLADVFNTAMELDDRERARSFFETAEAWPIGLGVFLLAVDLVRDYWADVAGGES